jgi:hypothetical protein
MPTAIPDIMKTPAAGPYPTSRTSRVGPQQYANQQLPFGLAPSAMKPIKPTAVVSSGASNKAKPTKEKSSKGGGLFSGLFSKGSSKLKLMATQKQACCPTMHSQALVLHGGLMTSQSLHGNVAAKGVTVNSILQQQQQQSSKGAAPPAPVHNQQPMRQKQMSRSLHGHTAANGMALKSILQQQQQQQSCKGASAPVPIQNQPTRQHQVYQTTQGSPPRQSFNLPQARPVALSSSQVQIQGQEFRNKNNPFGGRSDTSKNSNSGAPDSRMPLEYGRLGSERSLGGAMQCSDLRTPQLLQKQNTPRVQMETSPAATPQAGNTRMQRMRQQRRASSEREVYRSEATRMASIMDDLPMATSLCLSPSAMQPVNTTNVVSAEASNKANPKKEKSSKGDGLFSKGGSKQKLSVTQKQAGIMNPNLTPSGSNDSRLMKSQSLQGNAASNGVTVNSIKQQHQQQQQHQQSRKGGAPPLPIEKEQPMRQKQISWSLHGNTAANGMALKSILQQHQQQQQQHQSWKGASAPAPIQNQPTRLQKVFQTTQGSPLQQSFNLPQVRPVAISSSQVQSQGQGQEFRNKNNPFGGRSDTSNTINSGAPGSTTPLEYGRPGSEPRSLDGAMQYSDLRTPQLSQKQNALRVQMAASTAATPEAGNTRMQRMRQQRRASSEREVYRSQATRMASIMDDRPMATPMESDKQINLLAARMQQNRIQQGLPAPMQPGARTPSASMQPGVSGRGPGAAVYGLPQSERMEGGQQQIAHVTPTIQQMASHGASFRAAQQAQMFLDSSRPPSDQPRNLPDQMQRQGTSKQVFLARPVVGQYERGSLKQYSGQFAQQQRNSRTDFYESHQQQYQDGQHLSNLSLGSGSEGESYAAGYLHGMQQTTNNSMSVAGGGANPAIQKENSSKSMASQMLQGITGHYRKKQEQAKKRSVVENNNNVGGANAVFTNE